MFKENPLAASIFCFSIALIISAVIIGNGIKNNGNYICDGLLNLSNGVTNLASKADTNTDSAIFGRDTYNLPLAAAYLGISESKLIAIIHSKNSKIPYVKIGNDFVFSKHAIDKWLETARVEIKQ